MITEFEPKWIAWEITRRCNFNCVHCRSSSEMEMEGHPDFSTGEAYRIIDDIAGYAKPVMVLSGGEPLLRKDVFDIAKYGTDRDLRMCIATNGSLVTEEVCQDIKTSGIKMVSLSLDGATEEVHDDFRKQKGAFTGVINAAALFKRHGIKFLINSSFTKRNQKEIPRVYKLAKKLGATAWYMFMIVPTGRGEDMMKELISKEDYEELLAFYDFPAQHWQSIRTTNPIESTFGTIRHRTKRSKGCLTRDGMLHMMFKLGQCAENKLRKLRGFDYLAKVITGIKFKNGIEVTDVDQAAA